MSQPVKLSDALVLDARIAAEAQERSIAGQVEFWAKLGQAVEPMLTTREALELRRTGKVMPLSELLSTVETAEGHARTSAYLEGRPFPHYRQFQGQHRVYIRTDADGKETVGRFVNRAFVAIEDGRALKGSSSNAESRTGDVPAVEMGNDPNADRPTHSVEQMA
jgi:hypothetical protein